MTKNAEKEIKDEIELYRKRSREKAAQVEPDDVAMQKAFELRPGARIISDPIIEELLRVAKGEASMPVSFVQFIALWEAFNGWLRIPPANGIQLKKDWELLKDFQANPVVQQDFQQLAKDSSEYKQALANLKSLCPVYQVQGVGRTEVRLDEEANLGQVMEVIYAVRNNLFHGGKSLSDPRDQKLVTAAGNVLLPLFNQLLSDSEATYPVRSGE